MKDSAIACLHNLDTPRKNNYGGAGRLREGVGPGSTVIFIRAGRPSSEL